MSCWSWRIGTWLLRHSKDTVQGKEKIMIIAKEKRRKKGETEGLNVK